MIIVELDYKQDYYHFCIVQWIMSL